MNIDATALGIDTVSRKEPQLFRWFLACLLFGKPIQQTIARRAYDTLTCAGITSVSKLAETDWDTLVGLLDEAGYVRYDFSTATKLLQISNELKKQYGTVSRLIKLSADTHELERRLLAFKGVGPVTAGIFVGGVAHLWPDTAAPHDYEAAVLAATVLHTHGFEAFIIGGAVRDVWLGREPKDFDLVTNARPEQIMAIPEFTQSQYNDASQTYGVTRVRFTNQGTSSQLEVATFRRDIEAHRGRKATQVEFAELEDDVLRRDFTINALALDPSADFIIDYVDGIEDLEHRQIRFIGRPGERIREDPLRILRAVRFKNQLGFSYAPGTAAAIKKAVGQGYVEVIAADRIRDELTRMLLHPSRRSAMSDLDMFGMLGQVLPEVAAGKSVEQPPQYHAEGDVWQHELLILDYLPENPSKRLAWAAFLHDVGKPPTRIKPRSSGRVRFDRHYAVGAEIAKTAMVRLNFSNRDIKDVTWMIYNHLTVDDLPSMRPSRQQQMLGNPAFEDLLELHKADAAASWQPGSSHAHRPQFRDIERIWHQYQSKTPEHQQPSLKRDVGIDGSWLLAQFGKELHASDGPLIGDILSELEAWYRDEGITDKDRYTAKARQLLANRQR